jgi:Lrp/AsnC family leucine-responsive transcriptional regulator
MTPLLDEISLTLLRALEENARTTLQDLAKKVDLSGTAVSDRIRRLEEAGVITGYHAHTNHAKIGYPIRAFIRLKAPRDHYSKVIALARSAIGVQECHHVAKEDSFYLRVLAASDQELKAMVTQFKAYGKAKAAIITSTPVEKHTT